MLIPLELETPETFICRVDDALVEPTTQVYVDTSIMMWLTTIGPLSRSLFFTWAKTLGDRVHVPIWTLQEYYRHHRSGKLKVDIDEKSGNLESAFNEFGSHMRSFADGQLLSGEPEANFGREFERLRERLHKLTQASRRWDYRSASAEVIGWLNDRALDRSSAFQSLYGLKDYGAARYEHEVPPGYEDRAKAVNRFGDLLFWKDIVADASRRAAARVVILTKDRKQDWFGSSVEADAGPSLRRLRGRWDPVPVPHPMLSFELREQTGAELVLLDDLYLGAVLWRRDRVKYGRFSSIAFGMGLDRLQEEMAPPASIESRAAKRSAADRISLAEAGRIINAALACADDPAVSTLLVLFDEAAPSAEAAAEKFGQDMVSGLTVEQTAVIARRIYEMSIAGHPFASVVGRRLLELIDRLDAGRASAIIGGVLVGAFFEGSASRNRPSGELLQDAYLWQADPGCRRVLERLGARLKDAHSPALVLPGGPSERLKIVIETSTSVISSPSAVGQIYVGQQSVLAESALDGETLTKLLGDRQHVTVGEIVEAVARYYGIPLQMIYVVDAAVEEPRTVLSTTSLVRFSPSRIPMRGNSRPEPQDNAETNEKSDAMAGLTDDAVQLVYRETEDGAGDNDDIEEDEDE